MKGIALISICFLLVFTGCDKVKKNARTIDGTWTIYSYSQNQNGGFITYYETVGTITFVTKSDGTFTYQEDYSFTKDGILNVSNRQGSGKLTGDDARGFDLTITSPTSLFIENCEINVLTKDDLKLKYQEVDGAHIYVLQKN